MYAADIVYCTVVPFGYATSLVTLGRINEIASLRRSIIYLTQPNMALSCSTKPPESLFFCLLFGLYEFTGRYYTPFLSPCSTFCTVPILRERRCGERIWHTFRALAGLPGDAQGETAHHFGSKHKSRIQKDKKAWFTVK